MNELDAPFPLCAETIADYRENGYVRLKDVLAPETLAEYGAELTRVVRETTPADLIPPKHRALLSPESAEVVRRVFSRKRSAASDTYARAFTQRTNLWGLSAKVERFVRSRRLARIASELMGVAGVRLYHDQALYKEARGGHTPWHCDQYYWPLASDHTITAWIPLQPVSSEMGPLTFARGSHRFDDAAARGLAISDESEESIARLLAGFTLDGAPFDLGEVSFHAGWTFHRADANRTDHTRAAFTIIYMDRDISVREPDSDAQRFDLAIWMPGTAPGETPMTPINPVLYAGAAGEPSRL